MKKWLIRIVIVVLAVFLFIGLCPFSTEIHYSGTDYEFSLAGDGAVAEHEVIIDGVYSSSLFLKDHFQGTFFSYTQSFNFTYTLFYVVKHTVWNDRKTHAFQ